MCLALLWPVHLTELKPISFEREKYLHHDLDTQKRQKKSWVVTYSTPRLTHVTPWENLKLKFLTQLATHWSHTGAYPWLAHNPSKMQGVANPLTKEKK